MKRAECEKYNKNMATEIKHRRHRWRGHVLRMEQKRIPKKDLRWNPPGKRNHGRPKMTLRKTFKADLKTMKLTLGMAEREAKDKISLRQKSIVLDGQMQ